MRHLVWSLWNGWHLVNLFDLSHDLDGTLTDADIAPFQAAMVDALTEDHLRCLLSESGEMRRWEEAERETPEGFEVLYPPPPFRHRLGSTEGVTLKLAVLLKKRRLALGNKFWNDYACKCGGHSAHHGGRDSHILR